MPRPRKCKRVCCMPGTLEFRPVGEQDNRQPVSLTVDEYETIRLIDKENFSQEECAARMEVARTTVQQIYTTARRKLAIVLVEGLPLKIEGGEYRICDGDGPHCACAGCRINREEKKPGVKRKGGKGMRIAIPLDENKTDVCVAFGRAPFFMFYDTETKETNITDNPGAEAQGGAGLKAAQALVDEEPDVLLTVRCGENAAEVLKAAEVKIYKTEFTDAMENIKAFEDKKLAELTHFHAGFHGNQ